jgi:hypothetical protein
MKSTFATKKESLHPDWIGSRKKNPTGRSLFRTQDLRQNVTESRTTGVGEPTGGIPKSLRSMAFRHFVTGRLTCRTIRRTRNTHEKWAMSD